MTLEEARQSLLKINPAGPIPTINGKRVHRVMPLIWIINGVECITAAEAVAELLRK